MKDKINPKKSTGLIDSFGERDWFAGGNSPIKRKVLMMSGNWKDLINPHEIQVINSGKTSTYDTLMCVFYNGVTDGLEYIMNRQLELGLIPDWKIDWLVAKGYFKEGRINFSERFVAINGGITSQGASIWEGMTAARNKGLIPNDMFPMADNFKDNIDPKFITKEMYDLGLEFTKLFTITFEWLLDPVMTTEFIKYSPLICVGFYGNQENNNLLDPPHTGIQHCMLQVYETLLYREIDDSYWQQFKKYKKEALYSFMALYVDASDNSMFDAQHFINTHDKFIVRNEGNGAFGVIYAKTPLFITPERAGLFMIDRVNRGLIVDGEKYWVSLKNEEFNKIDWSKNF